MAASPGNPDTKPYGLHRLWLTGYTDSDGSVLGDTSYRMPLARKFAFTENEDTDTLDGDDKAAVAEEGKGATVTGTLEAGGLDMMTFSIITGGQLIESGIEPNVKRVVRKRGSDTRGYFRIEGQSLSGSSDNIYRVFRCKASGKIQADLAYGTFVVPSIDITGTPLPFDDADYLWEIEYNEQKTTLSSTPTPNPLPSVNNLTVGTIASTTVALSWTDVAIADSYVVEQSTDSGTTWTAVDEAHGGAPTDASTTVTTLTASTAYEFRVAVVVGAVTGDYCSPVSATTAAA